MSDLTERLRHVAWLAEEGSEVTDLAAAAADALIAAEAELARLEHQIQQAEEATTAAYKDAETAEAKLAAIDALPDDGPMNMTADTDYRMGHSDGWRDAMHAVHRILHPEEGQ